MKKLVKSIVVGAVLFCSYGMVSAQQKIGHVDTEEIIQLMPEYKTAVESVNAFVQTKQTEAQQMQGELQKKYASYLEKQKNLSEANRDVLGKELQALEAEMTEFQNRLQEHQQTAQQQIGEKNRELLQPVFTKLTTTIGAVAKEKGYAYVLDVAQQSVIYYEGGDNLNGDVRTKLGIAADAKPYVPTNPNVGAVPAN
ncbi:OmpH family outer membrane protein [Olivibacter sitiensis]|uniref:OmpH family outer membrane protein n=1 Tax=Olivibacter sitiensis TaxID=376470 RepID=UPI0006871DF4|nr:OmpH family outer membrane protein [Olivibacter sitiensis]